MLHEPAIKSSFLATEINTVVCDYVRYQPCMGSDIVGLKSSPAWKLFTVKITTIFPVFRLGSRHKLCLWLATIGASHLRECAIIPYLSLTSILVTIQNMGFPCHCPQDSVEAVSDVFIGVSQQRRQQAQCMRLSGRSSLVSNVVMSSLENYSTLRASTRTCRTRHVHVMCTSWLMCMEFLRRRQKLNAVQCTDAMMRAWCQCAGYYDVSDVTCPNLNTNDVHR